MPKAPGTWGTAAAMLAAAFIRVTAVEFAALTVAISLIGIWASGLAEREIGRKDPGCVVIDEVAGYFVTVAFLPHTWGYLAAGFVLFRFFDIVKPPPIRGLQSLKGGMGVMLDDLAAGVASNLVLRLCAIALLR